MMTLNGHYNVDLRQKRPNGVSAILDHLIVLVLPRMVTSLGPTGHDASRNFLNVPFQSCNRDNLFRQYEGTGIPF